MECVWRVALHSRHLLCASVPFFSALLQSEMTTKVVLSETRTDIKSSLKLAAKLPLQCEFEVCFVGLVQTLVWLTLAVHINDSGKVSF